MHRNAINSENFTYAQGILFAQQYLLNKYPNVFIMGQGLWSPWYVGSTMNNLDKDFGRERIIDTPVSEVATTGAGLGASLGGYRPIIVHPRMDFMILAVDQIVSQAAKWRFMFGGNSSAPITIRGIINRGGEQGAQHSQALHSWFAHIPGLRVVMPSTAKDARDLFIASVLSDDPVLYIDDRWLYEELSSSCEITELKLKDVRPQILKEGSDITLVGAGYSSRICLDVASFLALEGRISAEVIDLRVINPIHYEELLISVKKTRRLCVIDGGWENCGLAGEIIAGIMEKLEINIIKSPPMRFTLVDSPAPSSKILEDKYYLKAEDIAKSITKTII